MQNDEWRKRKGAPFQELGSSILLVYIYICPLKMDLVVWGGGGGGDGGVVGQGLWRDYRLFGGL